MSVQSEIDRINGAKSTIVANIKDSGVSVQEGARLEVLAPLVGDIVGQFSDELDLIIGGDTTPVTDITARLSAVNGVSGDVSTQLDTLDGTKTAIKDAIAAKGVDIPDGTVFRDYAAKIGEIETGGAERTIQTNGELITDNSSPLLPSSAKPGDIVPICGGTVSVSGFYIYRVGDGIDDKDWYRAFSANSLSNVPEVIKPVFENAPQTYSPAPDQTLYSWFIMPDFDVEISYYS